MAWRRREGPLSSRSRGENAPVWCSIATPHRYIEVCPRCTTVRCRMFLPRAKGCLFAPSWYSLSRRERGWLGVYSIGPDMMTRVYTVEITDERGRRIKQREKLRYIRSITREKKRHYKYSQHEVTHVAKASQPPRLANYYVPRRSS